MRYHLFLLFSCVLFCHCQSEPSTSQQASRIEQLAQLISENPENPDLFMERANLHIENGDLVAAIGDIEQLIRLDSLSEPTYEVLAELYFQTDQPDRAIHLLDKGLIHFPSSIQLGLKQAYFLYLMDQFDRSLSTLEGLNQKVPNQADVLFLRGLNLDAIGQIDQAIANYEQAIQADSLVQEGAAFLMLAELYTQQKDPKALKYFDDALRLLPDKRDAYLGKASYYTLNGESNKAQEIYGQLILQVPLDPEAYLASGLLYLEEGVADRAKEQLNLVIQLDPARTEAYYYRAVASEALGDPSAARLDYEQVLRFDPEWPGVPDALKRLSKAE